MLMDLDLATDWLSNLPISIAESILSRLPIRDAVRTSILSSKWRYRWTTLTTLVFNEKCFPLSNDRELDESSLINFITRVLLLHQGPIHKFQLSTPGLRSCPDIDQWLLFLSRNDLKELMLEMGDGEWFRVPSCLFSCPKLTKLELFRCELDAPLAFEGFPCLKSLTLHQVSVSSDAIECLIDGCPLLEILSLSYFDSFILNIRAPNLKFLCLEGEFKGVCLEHTPSLVFLSVVMYMGDDIVEQLEQISGCNFEKLLGGVPHLESLIGHVYFTKFLSIGNDLGRLSIMFGNLKNIELYQVSFEDTTEIQIVMRLITNSPSLQELHISGSSNTVAALEAPDLDLWKQQNLDVCTFKHLRTVNMGDLCGIPHEMEFIKFLLAHSPVLEVMSIQLGLYTMDVSLNMLVELVRFRRASARAEILFLQD